MVLQQIKAAGKFTLFFSRAFFISFHVFRKILINDGSLSSFFARPQGSSYFLKGPMKLFLPKLLSFLTSLSAVVWMKYSNLLLLSAGYSRTQVGSLKSLGYFIKLGATPLWALCSDTYGDPVVPLIISYVGGVFTLEMFRATVLLSPNQFNKLIGVRIIRSGMNAVAPLTDALILRYTEQAKIENEGYGRQRLFSSVAWGLGAWGGGILVDKYSLWSIFPFTQGTYFSVLFVLISMKLIDKRKNTRDAKAKAKSRAALVVVPIISPTNDGLNESGGQKTKTQAHRSSPMDVIRSTGTMLMTRSIRPFCFQIVLLGFMMVLVDTVLPLQIEHLNFSRSFNGLTTLISIVATVPIFWNSDRVYRAKGAKEMIRIAFIALTVRLVLLSSPLGEEPWFILFVQCSHGISFAMGWVAAVERMRSFANDVAGGGTEIMATAQAIVTALYFTIGQGVGNVFWLKLFDYLVPADSEGSPAKLYFFGSCVILLNLKIGLKDLGDHHHNDIKKQKKEETSKHLV